MKLQDREILELNVLCGALIDGSLNDAQRARLVQMLRDSEAARRYYVRELGQSASLSSYAAESHADAPRAIAPSPTTTRATGWWYGAIAAAIMLAVVGWAWRSLETGREIPDGARPASQFVARITGAKDAQLARSSVAIAPGAPLHRNQSIELSAGAVEITFDSGARVVLDGAASLDINSAWGATLRRGTLKASVPPEAIGFRISNPMVEVVDLGTEFTMIADGNGAADVLVLKGEVEAAPRTAPNQETILLRENESRRFASSGISAVAESERKFALFAQPLSLQRFAPPQAFAHWSFDELRGDEAKAELVGLAMSPAEAHMKIMDADFAVERPQSPRGRALALDGRRFAKGRFPGISGPRAHTAAFWVRVPEDAQLSEAYTMVAWATTLPKLSYRPVQISWNRRREEGVLGALRTDFGGGSAIGTTSLRDGRWHHVAVCFAAGEDPGEAVQVKQYIDGRLESSTIIPGKTRAMGSADQTLTDTVWVGRRLTGGQKYPERFRGEIDELFITPRGLEPNEIVALMKDSQLPASGLAASDDHRR